jgi:hypothetical protein
MIDTVEVTGVRITNATKEESARSIAVRTGLRRQVWWERFEQRGQA